MTDPSAPRTPDPGSPRAARLAWIILVVTVGTLIVLNQFFDRPGPAPVATFQAPGLDQLTILSKFYVKVSSLLPMSEADAVQMVAQVDAAARTPVEKVRAAVVAGELLGPDAAEQRLEKLAAHEEASEVEGLGDDIDALRALLHNQELDEARTGRLLDRHGWFARLALSRDKPDSDPRRQAVVRGGLSLLLLVVIAIGAFVLACAGAIGAIVVLLVQATQGKLRARLIPPAPGGSVYLELPAVLLAAMLLLRLAMSALAGALGSVPHWFQSMTLGAQWLCVLVLAYPLLRGASREQFRVAVGWTAPRGVWREIGAGIVGYCAGFPLLLLAIGITFVIVLMRGPDAPEPQNPVKDILLSAGTLDLILIWTLAVIWAPLVEETVFRGALYRHIRSRAGMLLAAVVSGLLFGIVHGYSYFLLLPVIVLGFNFALIREWRGSLIPCITAHALHNGTLLTLAILFLQVLRD
jgi:membrane protease YdiL (CAAX protease family)